MTMLTLYNNLQFALVGKLSDVGNIHPILELTVPRLQHEWCGVVSTELLPDDVVQSRVVGCGDDLFLHTKRHVIAKHSVCYGIKYCIDSTC